MAFPTSPTGAQIQTNTQADTSGTRTFPSLTSLTKSAGDLLLAIVIAYQSTATANAVWSSWGGGFTEFGDFSTTSSMAIGCAYKFSTGSETGTFTVTQGATITGHAAMWLVDIQGAHPTAPPEAGGYGSGTNANPDAGSLTPSWGADDTLWVAVGGSGETSTTGTFGSITGDPAGTNSSSHGGISADVVGGLCSALAFIPVNTATEDPTAFTADTSNTRWGAITIAIRPVPPAWDGVVMQPIMPAGAY